jgi:hypothetical protein
VSLPFVIIWPFCLDGVEGVNLLDVYENLYQVAKKYELTILLLAPYPLKYYCLIDILCPIGIKFYFCLAVIGDW